ncbi:MULTISPECIES: MCE family protein [unclassified Mycobacterium]|uniref:MCE family protein n=1 Tax=unclassified Mycobacterium TaxID=2642494 RepID=UPI00055B36B9|nr:MULTISPECIES: MCE family protein [unclassified Mycobacterium]SEA61260.1 phospholipid/cholesterol/gamma-HCH transport system substrate-binding protein [Mycobacterium sp. 283mftsu]
MKSRWLRHAGSAAILIAVVAGTGGCTEWRGLNSLPLPGTEGGGPGSFEVQAQLPDVNNLQPNARVRVADVTVGSVTKIERQGWHALVTMRMSGDVDVPANSTIKLGLTSLLGTVHLELGPPSDGRPMGKLHAGSLIPLASAGSFPTVEQTLAALSMVLNGGGVGQIQDITEALSTAFRGREQDLRSLIGQLDEFTGHVNEQTPEIIAANESLNQVVGRIAADQKTLDRAIDTIPKALAVLNSERNTIVDAANAMAKFSALATDTINQSKENLVKELKELGPTLESLANAGPALTRSLSLILTLPFPNETIEKWQRGDYANLTAIFDLTLSRIDAGFFTGTRWECDLTELELQWGRTIGQFPSPCTAGGPNNPGNPLTIPYRWDQGP